METMKILIVDDSMLFREVVNTGLKSRLPRGTQIDKAGDPFEARDKIMSFDPDIMILDVEMPNMNGIEFLKRLIVQYNLPTIVSSSRGIYKELAIQAGAYGFVEKPSSSFSTQEYLDNLAREVTAGVRRSRYLIQRQQTAEAREKAELQQIADLVRQADADAASSQRKVRYASVDWRPISYQDIMPKLDETPSASARSAAQQVSAQPVPIGTTGTATRPVYLNSAAAGAKAATVSSAGMGNSGTGSARVSYAPVNSPVPPQVQPLKSPLVRFSSAQPTTASEKAAPGASGRAPGYAPSAPATRYTAVSEMTRKDTAVPAYRAAGENEPMGKPEIMAAAAPGSRYTVIAIGASTGGTEALAKILTELRPPLPPIVIVQHIPPMFSRLFAERLDSECVLAVKEAANGDKLEANHVYVAPGSKQMSLKGYGSVLQLDVRSAPKVNGHCPSVDVLFNSVAEKIGSKALGVILTGMGEDGARGLLKMREAGASTLGQDEATCVVYGMPRAAFEMGAVKQQLPLPAMAGAITGMARSQGGTDDA